MAQESAAKQFLQELTHQVVTAEMYWDPQTPDEYYTALQSRQDADALILYVSQALMFLNQRLGKLPKLPDITTLIVKKYADDKEEEKVEQGQG